MLQITSGCKAPGCKMDVIEMTRRVADEKAPPTHPRYCIISVAMIFKPE
jgi:hypothetical protein